MVTYFELTYLGRPRTDGPRRKPRFPIPTWSINVSVLEETEFSANCSESWNSVSRLTVVSKPSLWQLLIQLKAEDASMKAKMMAITTRAWKDNNPGRSARRTDKKAALKSLVEDYYTMDPGLFLEAAISFYDEF